MSTENVGASFNDNSVQPTSKSGRSIRLRFRSHFGHGLLAFKHSA